MGALSTSSQSESAVRLLKLATEILYYEFFNTINTGRHPVALLVSCMIKSHDMNWAWVLLQILYFGSSMVLHEQRKR